MLLDYLEKLCKELAINTPKINQEKAFLLRVGGESIDLKDLEPGVALHAKIGSAPQKKREELFIYLMRANLLGQGTGSARIGLSSDEKLLTLSLGLPYEMNYQVFREAIEDFVNYLIYWRDEVTKFETEETLY